MRSKKIMLYNEKLIINFWPCYKFCLSSFGNGLQWKGSK